MLTVHTLQTNKKQAANELKEKRSCFCPMAHIKIRLDNYIDELDGNLFRTSSFARRRRDTPNFDLRSLPPSPPHLSTEWGVYFAMLLLYNAVICDQLTARIAR
jgi:hypothetical protein